MDTRPAENLNYSRQRIVLQTYDGVCMSLRAYVCACIEDFALQLVSNENLEIMRACHATV